MKKLRKTKSNTPKGFAQKIEAGQKKYESTFLRALKRLRINTDFGLVTVLGAGIGTELEVCKNYFRDARLVAYENFDLNAASVYANVAQFQNKYGVELEKPRGQIMDTEKILNERCRRLGVDLHITDMRTAGFETISEYSYSEPMFVVCRHPGPMTSDTEYSQWCENLDPWVKYTLLTPGSQMIITTNSMEERVHARLYYDLLFLRSNTGSGSIQELEIGGEDLYDKYLILISGQQD
jgi:hypothetical protein